MQLYILQLYFKLRIFKSLIIEKKGFEENKIKHKNTHNFFCENVLLSGNF